VTDLIATPNEFLSRRHAEDRDCEDPLAAMRAQFAPIPEGEIFLNGGSLGRQPVATVQRLEQLLHAEWADGLASARTQWFDIAQRVGRRVAEVVLGAHPDEAVVSDCTSVNLYKLAAAAIHARPERRAVVIDDDNFPTDRYVLSGVAEATGRELRVVHADPHRGLDLAALEEAVDSDVALVALSLVSPRSGALLDMAEVHRVAHRVGALVLWDLSHAAGAIPLELTANGADLAVGSTYKHMFAGPGAPAFLYVRRDLQAELRQPIHGWYGHREQLAMRPLYDPDPSIRRFLTGSPPVLSVAAIEPGLDLLAHAGINAVRAKSVELVDYVVQLATSWLFPCGWRLASPHGSAQRAAHVAFAHRDAQALVAAARERGVHVDYSPPDRIRISPAPLSTSFTEVYEAMIVLRDTTTGVSKEVAS